MAARSAYDTAVRTYLYVDGENFAIRARRLHEEIAKEPKRHEQTVLNANALCSVRFETFDVYGNHYPKWVPAPVRAVRDGNQQLTRNGILHVADEVYWDVIGLYIAMMHAIPEDPASPHGQVQVDRATYFASSNGNDGRAKRARELHQLGFTPHVFQRTKPDDLAKALAKDGITVVSRPKPLDILLATMVLEDANQDNFDRCILVAGDEDYVPLIEAVRRKGKQVWVVAFDRWVATDGALRLAADRFIPYDMVLAVRPLPALPMP